MSPVSIAVYLIYARAFKYITSQIRAVRNLLCKTRENETLQKSREAVKMNAGSVKKLAKRRTGLNMKLVRVQCTK